MPPNRKEHRRHRAPAAVTSDGAVPATILWAKAIEGTNLFALRLSDGAAVHTFALQKSNAQLLVDSLTEGLLQGPARD